MEEPQQTDSSTNKNASSALQKERIGFRRTLAITFGLLQLGWLAWLGWVAWKVLSA